MRTVLQHNYHRGLTSMSGERSMDTPAGRPSCSSARRRWRHVKLITLPVMRTRLMRARAFRLARERQATLEASGLVHHATYLRKLQVGVLYGGVVENALLDVRVTRATDHCAALVRQGQVVVDAEAGGTDEIALWRQGDTTLSTRTKFEQRLKLRHTPAINAVLHTFWTLAARCSSRDAMLHSGSPGLFDVTLGFDDYHALFSRVFTTLVDDYDEDDARKTIEEDFANDSKGDGVLSCSEYCDALFELADSK